MTRKIISYNPAELKAMGKGILIGAVTVLVGVAAVIVGVM